MRAIFFFVPFAMLTLAQTQGPEFEAAVIKPSTAADASSSGVATEKGRVNAHNVTLRRCIRGAYDLPEIRIIGGPKWIDEERYDILAKAPGPSGDHDLMLMLQALLAERFQLAVHRETRQMSGYALVVAKGGPSMHKSEPDAGSRTNSNRGAMDAQASNMAGLALRLTDLIHLPVADMTGLSGAFDFQLRWNPADPLSSSSAGAESRPSIFAALQEQLGLKLESRKVPVEVLVVDRAEHPTAN